jgi:hypothetical protein
MIGIIESCSADSFNDESELPAVTRRRLVRLHGFSVPGILVGLWVASLAGCLSNSNDPASSDRSAALTDTTAVPGTDDADYGVVPGGLQVHRSCIHELADSDVVDQTARVIQSADGSVKPVALPCAFPARKIDPALKISGSQQSNEIPPTDNGYTELAYWVSPRDMRQFGTSFHTPAAPRVYTNQLIYLFPALETDNWDSIMQSVLQYGSNGSFGGGYWTIASWAGGAEWGGNYYHSPPTTAISNPLRGGIWWTNDCRAGGCVWHIATCGNVCTELAIRTDRIWPVLFGGAVEVYKIDDCAKYPATYEDFYNFFLQDAAGLTLTPAWTRSIRVTTCRESIDIPSPNLINMHYNL